MDGRGEDAGGTRLSGGDRADGSREGARLSGGERADGSRERATHPASRCGAAWICSFFNKPRIRKPTLLPMTPDTMHTNHNKNMNIIASSSAPTKCHGATDFKQIIRPEHEHHRKFRCICDTLRSGTAIKSKQTDKVLAVQARKASPFMQNSGSRAAEPLRRRFGRGLG